MEQRGRTDSATPGAQRPARDGSGRRLHMGVATSDPQYLSTVDPIRTGHPTDAKSDAPRRPAHPRGEKRAPLHYDRYLETPKPGKSIFSARHERARRRTRNLIVTVALIALIIALVWFFFLR